MHVGVIFPQLQTPENLARWTSVWQEAAPDGMKISSRAVAKGPRQVLDEVDIAESAPHVAALAEEYSADVDALVISCILDPGLPEARAVSSVPVVGPGESTLLVAAQASDNFAIATPVAPSLISKIVARHGYGDRVTSVRQVPSDAFRLLKEGDSAPLLASISDDMADAVHNERADMVVLLCCGFPLMRDAVREKVGVPTMAPLAPTLAMVQQILSTGDKVG